MPTDAGIGKVYLIFKSMVSKKFAKLYNIWKEYWRPAQDCLNQTDHCNLLFLPESML